MRNTIRKISAMFPTSLSVSRMGAIAGRILAEGGQASVHGSTSRGCFLMVRSRWALFVTEEDSPGPLNLNLRGGGDALRELRQGTPVEIQATGLKITSPPVYLNWELASRWKPSPRPAAWLSPEERRKRKVEIAEHLVNRPDASGTGRVIARLLGIPVEVEAKVDPLFSMEEVEGFQAALGSWEVRRILPVLDRFLGRGPGLTPSGDDLIAGLLLALHRWGDVVYPNLDLAELGQELPPLAYHKTTTLAANLIECASNGQADERLLNALDGLMAGEPGPSECAEYLLDYGSSSGCDAYLGMLLVESFVQEGNKKGRHL